MSQSPNASMVSQLRRQAFWLKDSWLWVLRNRVLEGAAGKPSSLDVGCGPGFVMEVLSEEMDVSGIDVDEDMVKACKARGLRAVGARAEDLPFDDHSFDVVYCSFLLLWVKDPVRVMEEMGRVSGKWVVCLAEPDYGARIDYPEGLSEVPGILARGITEMGGDPFVGRKLRSIFKDAHLEAEIGVHPGVWSIERLREESEAEWAWIEAGMKGCNESEIERLRSAWREALRDGTLFQYNPIFYALAKK